MSSIDQSVEFLDNLKVVDIEWQAWKKFVHEFAALTSINLNDDKCRPFVGAARLWGERLVQLRMRQAPEVLDRALDDAIDGVT